MTLQKAQARVQVSPMIIRVACFWLQHSPMFGQAASSHTVTRPLSFTMALVALYWPEPGALTRSQSGFFSTAVSGRFCFSG